MDPETLQKPRGLVPGVLQRFTAGDAQPARETMRAQAASCRRYFISAEYGQQAGAGAGRSRR